jgi:hypothetical protein
MKNYDALAKILRIAYVRLEKLLKFLRPNADIQLTPAKL